MYVKDHFVGIRIYGFCNGFFGRDNYETKDIIASGKDWIVAVCEENIPRFASFHGYPDGKMAEYIEEWSKYGLDDD
ncbi:hypothetical protein ABGV42_00965 [Paenibacillus pabuli]|uniref:hypothetical protein n=1 Tax=Paenibacillus pabuli TaxID=1472 RepID=UPI003241C0D8